MWLSLTVLLFFLLGRELSFRFWSGTAEPLAPAERITSAATIGLALWLASLWVLALSSLLTFPAVMTRNAIVASIAAALWLRPDRPSPRAKWDGRLLLLLPVAAWVLFVLWRGAMVPPASHDVLSHHLPKAITYVRSGGYDPMPVLPARSRNIPANYELLLADALLAEGSDALTEWPSTIHYLFFVVAAVALAQRWWGSERAADAALALMVAGLPVALLHSGGHKNDLLAGALMTAALLWLGRFIGSGEVRSLILAAAALAMAAGTKPHAALLAFAAMPAALWQLWRGGDFVRRAAGIAALSVLFVALLGGAYWPLGRGAQIPAAPSSGQGAYGDWENLYQVPYVLLAAPFAAGASTLHVPWSERPWFWRRYELFFSELGIPFALCALLLPAAIPLFGRYRPERRLERAVVSAVAAVGFLAMLPIVFRPAGMFAISMPRYVLFLVPVIFAWTIAPLLRFAATPFLKGFAVAAAAAVFVCYALLAAVYDAFVSPEFVRQAARDRGTRVIAYDPKRAASLVDARAGADTPVAMEAADGAWLLPLYGADLRRPVQLLRAGVPPRDLRPDVEWVAIDRKFTAIWRHGDLVDLSQAEKHASGGAVALEDDPFFRFFADDGRWELVHFDGEGAQAVCRRRG